MEQSDIYRIGNLRTESRVLNVKGKSKKKKNGKLA